MVEKITVFCYDNLVVRVDKKLPSKSFACQCIFLAKQTRKICVETKLSLLHLSSRTIFCWCAR